MPTAASAALRAAFHDALVADAALVSVLGGPKIYDEPPRILKLPWEGRASPIFPPAASRPRNTS